MRNCRRVAELQADFLDLHMHGMSIESEKAPFHDQVQADWVSRVQVCVKARNKDRAEQEPYIIMDHCFNIDTLTCTGNIVSRIECLRHLEKITILFLLACYNCADKHFI